MSTVARSSTRSVVELIAAAILIRELDKAENIPLLENMSSVEPPMEQAGIQENSIPSHI